MLRLKSINSTVADVLMAAISTEIMQFQTKPPAIKIKSASFFTMLSSINYAANDRINTTISSEIGLYDHSKREFTRRVWKEISGGELIVIDVLEKDSLAGDQQHKFIYSQDLHNRVTLFAHTWNRMAQRIDLSQASVGVSYNLRVLTYNLWHNNPPSWVYPDSQ